MEIKYLGAQVICTSIWSSRMVLHLREAIYRWKFGMGPKSEQI